MQGQQKNWCELVVLSQKILSLIEEIGSRQAIRSKAQVQDFHNWVAKVPKIETHVHLEAAVEACFYESLKRPASWLTSCPWDRGPFIDLRSFIMAWVDLTRSITKIEDFEALAQAFVSARVQENIRYTEAYFSPADYSFIRKRFSISPNVFLFEEVLAAYVRGLKKALAEHPGFEVRLIMDALWPSTRLEREMMRDALKSSLSLPEFFDEYGRHYIVGVGLGGAESHHDLDGHIAFMEEVRELGFKVDIHSGEGSDASVHQKSVESLNPDRVAHGFSGVKDGYIFSQSVVMCPISNILLGTHLGLPEEHPIFSLLHAGVPVSIGSDDPLLLGHNLSSEYSFLYAINECFSDDMFRLLQENARTRVLAPDVCSRVNLKT